MTQFEQNCAKDGITVIEPVALSVLPACPKCGFETEDIRSVGDLYPVRNSWWKKHRIGAILCKRCNGCFAERPMTLEELRKVNYLKDQTGVLAKLYEEMAKRGYVSLDRAGEPATLTGNPPVLPNEEYMNVPYMVTWTGHRISLNDNNTQGIPNLHDIAVNHCREPMFAGHSSRPYAVAHHCLSAGEMAQVYDGYRIAYFTLLHELEVTAFGDIPVPVKSQAQRGIEKKLRDKYWEHTGQAPTDAEWERVEFWDKIEQAASVRVVGLQENVHERIWAPTDDKLKAYTIAVVRANYFEYPPAQQLETDSRLATKFIYRAEELYRLIS